MIRIVKRKISIEKELLSKIKWACTFSNCKPKIKNGNLRMVEKTNIAYVEPHSVVIKEGSMSIVGVLIDKMVCISIFF